MNGLDKILELLRDTKDHSLEEIKKEIPLPEEQLNEALRFLGEQSYIKKENDMLKITDTGLKFLTLPS